MSARSATRGVPRTASPGARACSVLGALSVLGDFWTLSLLRCAVYGERRFGGFQRELGIASNVLSDRLARLVHAGVLDRVAYQENPTRYEYALTDTGRELVPIVVALKDWGDQHLQPDGPYTEIRHASCGGHVRAAATCLECGQPVALGDLETRRLRPDLPH
jgi:DNA-binding HxlR family transcriptional regulator